MAENKTVTDCIVFPLDLPTVAEAAGYVRQLSGRVGMFKIGLELFIAGGGQIIEIIRECGDSAIFLDLKLHDIPATVGRAMERIAAWDGVAFATVHCGESPAMLKAAVSASSGRVGVLGVTVLTSVSGNDLQNAGFDPVYADNPGALVMKRAQMARDAGCAGVVCSGRESAAIKAEFGKNFITMVPGIRPDWSAGKEDQKRVVTPAAAVQSGADYLVIGRPIRDAKDPGKAAEQIAAEIRAAAGGGIG
ncbi:MAG: orotidine-5'-phosphate decarboxylase [Desulfobacterales bacterium]|nr:orotidine-5'-phosphate decarboxylase [Desulfobacterales bacterium]